MAMIRKTITVTEKQNEWIQEQMSSGNYGTDSEIIREAIREKQMRVAEIESIRAKLIEGENSSFSDIDPKDFSAELKKKAKKLGKI